MKSRVHGLLRLWLPVILLLATLSVGSAVGAYIQDPDFGDGGVKIVEIGNLDDRGYSATVMDDGKIVVAGTSDVDTLVEVAVIRFNEKGELDTTFNVDGKATFALASGDSGANDVVGKADGNILVAGYSKASVAEDEKKRPALLQITQAGIQDSSFASDTGVAILEDGDNGGEAFAVTLDEEKRILVAGRLQSETQSWAFVARYLEDGTLDTTFNGTGFHRIESDGNTGAAFVALQEDGNIIVGGTKEKKDDVKTAVLYRLSDDGTLDTTYGTDGEAVLGDFATDSEFLSGVVATGERLVAAGYTSKDGSAAITSARFTSAGLLDTSYGTAGMAVTDFAGSSAAYSIKEKNDGTYLLVGEGLTGLDNDIVLIHLDSNGKKLSSTVLREAEGDPGSDDTQLIATPELDEPLVIDIDGENDSGRAVVVLNDGRVLVAGFTSDGNHDDMAMVAFVDEFPPNPPDGTDVFSRPYNIGTIPVSNVSRNSAMSGGVISENPLYVCIEDANGDCERPTVTARGVAYGVAVYPSYTSSDDTTATDTTTTDATDTSVFPDWLDKTAYNYDMVRRGQTADGPGIGTFGSDINEITPDVYYYVRAYAVLSDESVVYGNQVTFSTEDACFIATAAYGSVLQPHVRVLRQFRDRFLKTNGMGEKLVGLYYHFSPPLADTVAQSPVLRFAARTALLPLVGFSYFMVYLTLQMKLALLVLLGASLYSLPFFTSRR